MSKEDELDAPTVRPKKQEAADPNNTIVVARSVQQGLISDTTPDGNEALLAEERPREVLVASEMPPQSILELVRLEPATRLVVEGRVASGGMGRIDVAVDRALERRVAMKTLHPELRADEQSVRMFLREARLTGLLDHPHIVPVYDIAEGNDGQLYFTMKLVEGKTLQAIADALPRGVPDTATLYMLLDVVARVCDALAFAHSKGVLHCDLKPANVMVGEYGQVFLMDWGIAKIVKTEEAITPSKRPKAGAPSMTDDSIIGTTCYMSPEQARGDRKALDARSDVFLIGALLYELLTHRPPYVSKDRLETLLMAQAAQVISPRRIAGELAVPLELDRIVMRAMAKDPADRYPSVAALKEDVVRFMRGGAEFPRKTFAEGEIIVAEGDEGDAAYIVVEGRCEVSKEIGNGPQVLHTIGVGGVFGEMAILTKSARTATVVAAEATTCLVVTSQVLEQELAALKPWMATLLKSLATRFRDIDTAHRATFAHAPSPARIANQVLMHVLAWGEDGAIAWSKLVADLEAQLGSPPLTLFAVIGRYGLELDVEADRLRIPDVDALRERLRGELG
ncbi:MAG: protein kinase [Labilithrix sp.]|nr:protein kinase [Labilithrix sp.]MCW5813863.1 protein kinase [Labilithrix sp.]